MTTPNETPLRELIERARAEVQRICHGNGMPKAPRGEIIIRIPAMPDDTDVVIDDALKAAEETVELWAKMCGAFKQERDALRADLEAARRDLSVYRDELTSAREAGQTDAHVARTLMAERDQAQRELAEARAALRELVARVEDYAAAGCEDITPEWTRKARSILSTPAAKEAGDG